LKKQPWVHSTEAEMAEIRKEVRVASHRRKKPSRRKKGLERKDLVKKEKR